VRKVVFQVSRCLDDVWVAWGRRCSRSRRPRPCGLFAGCIGNSWRPSVDVGARPGRAVDEESAGYCDVGGGCHRQADDTPGRVGLSRVPERPYTRPPPPATAEGQATGRATRAPKSGRSEGKKSVTTRASSYPNRRSPRNCRRARLADDDQFSVGVSRCSASLHVRGRCIGGSARLV
jgi:hypothetical protein